MKAKSYLLKILATFYINLLVRVGPKGNVSKQVFEEETILHNLANNLWRIQN
jgi:hypothetical protein